MKPPHPFKHTILLSGHGKLAPLAAVVVLAFGARVGAQTTISGLGAMSTTGSGAWTGDNRWSTIGGDSIVSMYVVASGNLSGPFINGPADAQAAVSIPLGLGLHTFTLFAPAGIDTAYYGLNMFFNGDNHSPGISVFAPVQTSPVPPFPAFAANASPASQALNGQTVPAANSLTFVDGPTRVTLTDFHWAAPQVYNLDRVGVIPFVESFVGPDGEPDRVAQFTLEVVPEPRSWALACLGGLLLGWRACRHRLTWPHGVGA